MWPDLKFLESSSWRYEENYQVLEKLQHFIVSIICKGLLLRFQKMT